jgi:hypothetical protein
MQLIFSSLNLHEVHHLKNLLEVEGIHCHIKNELLSRLAGEIPFTECAPELWLLDERDLERAKRIVADFGRGTVFKPLEVRTAARHWKDSSAPVACGAGPGRAIHQAKAERASTRQSH